MDLRREDDSSTARQVFRDWCDARFQGNLPLALSARIPLEVFEFLIDEMDPPTLAAAALVCAPWYPRAMHNLYHGVDIRRGARFNMLFKQYHTSPRVKQRLANTCKLIVDEDALRFIRTDLVLALSRFKSVNSLTLDQCRLNKITQLRRIVSAFPQLTDFTMHSIQFAEQGAASYTGASLFQPSSHARLRYLDVSVYEERMPMFINWMTCSSLCTSLTDLTVRFDDPSMVQTPLQKLLETVGASLTYYREDYDINGRGHVNLSQNTALRFLDFGSHRVKHEGEDQGQGAWTKTTDELHGIFSTIRSHPLEHIEFRVHVSFDNSILEPEQPGVVLEKLDRRDLHRVMGQPYFDALKIVEVKMYLVPQTYWASTPRACDIVDQKLVTMFGGILQPWSARGIVNVT
ncbi:uncharacterized protein B0H18DRAFT_1121239 [Fomitopsis serialis]|uniref:uncharacterized protein n=1 Tax=Fomitopsis serialis TaxID=139415 RepID=UPI0020073AFD|nr:uncharacterized protein B0H18DRAFT_1121239 [Neoantrodia serialis]KAH9921781.1 hypothetical protein B0H18DRAFT_1121239 [Neoantrodia serialis]